MSANQNLIWNLGFIGVAVAVALLLGWGKFDEWLRRDRTL